MDPQSAVQSNKCRSGTHMCLTDEKCHDDDDDIICDEDDNDDDDNVDNNEDK